MLTHGGAFFDAVLLGLVRKARGEAPRYIIETAADRGEIGPHDAPVCPVCERIAEISRAGAGFTIASAVNLLDEMEEMLLGGDELEDALPNYPTLNEVENMGVRVLTQAGWTIPGFHPFCRCEIALL